MLTQYKKSQKSPLHKTILVAVCIISALGVILIFSKSLINIAQSDSVPFSTKAVAAESISTPSVGLPMHIEIPSIGVDTTIYYVGVKSDGSMDIKEDPTQVAWYKFGSRPGNNGTAVIAGHYGWIGEKGSVFNNLHNLVKGDEVLIIDDKGLSTTFIVRESKKYDPDADTSGIFNSNDNKAHLNLITCDGTWESAKDTYSDRLVVFTDKKVD